jgi:transcriptional regulator with XRE-family HTH domain
MDRIPGFGALLTRLREERGLSQSELADAAGVSDSVIAKAEQRGVVSWRPGNAMKIFRALDQRGTIPATERAAFGKATGLKLPPPPPDESEGGRPARAYSLESAQELVMDAAEAVGIANVQRILEVLADIGRQRQVMVEEPPHPIDLGGGVRAIERRTTRYTQQLPPPRRRP